MKKTTRGKNVLEEARGKKWDYHIVPLKKTERFWMRTENRPRNSHGEVIAMYGGNYWLVVLLSNC